MSQRISWRVSLAGAVMVLAMGFAAIAGMGLTRPANALTNCTVSSTAIDSEEQAFLGLINNYRAQNGLGALSISTNLTRAATWHATDMGAKNYFSHTDSLGRSPSTRATDCGYPIGAGENIAAGGAWQSAQSAFTAWKNSSGHNANMLYGPYKQIGIARVYNNNSTYGWYWVTDFGTTTDGTSGGGSTSPAPTQPPASSPASISSPSNGATLPGASATFTWGGVSGAAEYFLYAGTSQGSNNITGRSTGTSTSLTVSNLPTNGSAVHIRLWTRFSSGWQYRDFSYTASTATAVTSTKAAMTSPAAGTQLPGSTATFNWGAASGASQYFLYVGTSQGSNNIVGVSTGLNRSLTVNNIPRGSQPVYVRLWTLGTSGWQYNDYTYWGAP
jgi:hypothetical protein